MTSVPSRKTVVQSLIISKGLFAGDIGLIQYIVKCVNMKTSKKLISFLQACPDQNIPSAFCTELGHPVTTCTPEECCLYFIKYIQENKDSLTFTAAVRACVGGHVDYVWNVLMSASNHSEYVKSLHDIYKSYGMAECLLAAIYVCRGHLTVSQKNILSINQTKSISDIPANEHENTILSSTKYLDIITIFDKTKDVAPAQNLFVQDYKWLNIDKWNVKENTVFVTLET